MGLQVLSVFGEALTVTCLKSIDGFPVMKWHSARLKAPMAAVTVSSQVFLC